jgi:hypothetical protein
MHAASALTQLRFDALATLLEDVKAHWSWTSIAIQWNQICSPIKYMPPKVAPTAGNIEAAERLFEELGLTRNNLRRRYLVQGDLPDEVYIWCKAENKKTGVHGTVFWEIMPKAK